MLPTVPVLCSQIVTLRLNIHGFTYAISHSDVSFFVVFFFFFSKKKKMF